jgi:hypothetical protein
MTDDELDWLGLIFLERAAARLQLVNSADMSIPEAIAGLIPAMQQLSPHVHCRCVCQAVERAERQFPPRRPYRRAA